MKVASVSLKVGKAIAKGAPVSLMVLFGSSERFERFVLDADLQENEKVSLQVGDVGSLQLPVGNDMAAGQKKTLMTMFWYPERTQLMDAQRDVAAGEELTVEIQKAVS